MINKKDAAREIRAKLDVARDIVEMVIGYGYYGNPTDGYRKLKEIEEGLRVVDSWLTEEIK